MSLSFPDFICKVISVIIVAVKINKKIIKAVAEFMAQNRYLLNVNYTTTGISKTFLSIVAVVHSFSWVPLFATHQAPVSLGFPRQE